jgi:hypothetical protein
MPAPRLHRLALAGAVLLALPCAAQARALTPISVLGHATPPVQVLILGLAAAILGALALGAMGLAGRRLGGGFLRGLRFAGPVAGLLGAGWSGLNMAVGLANLGHPVPINVLAPGLAEAMMLVVLGLLAGLAAVLAQGAMSARAGTAQA